MKKIFTLFAALAMVLSMSAETKTIYCKMAQDWWKADGAAVGAHFWGSAGDGTTWPGNRMTAVAGETDLWSIDIDTDKYQNIIFTRVNGSGTVVDWGTKTGDLAIPTDDKNLFTITNTSASWGGGCVGTWSVYAPDAPKTYKDITIVVTANAAPQIHYWEGGDKMVGTDWENLPTMTATANPNEYTYTIKDVDEAIGVKYLLKVGDAQTANQFSSENVTADFKDLMKQVVVMGVTGWDGDKMTIADDYLTASVTLSLDANKEYELKLTVNGEWFGENTIAITKENNSAVFETNGENGKITTDLDGDYVFTYTYATKTLVVTYPELPTPTYDITIAEGTKETSDRLGRVNVAFLGTDETHGDISLTINNFVADQASYDVAGTVGKVYVNGTATLSADEEKETLTATLAAEDGSANYNVTISVALAPATQEYNINIMEGVDVSFVDYGEGYIEYTVEGLTLLGEEEVEIGLTFDTYGYIMGTINDIYVMGEGAEVTTETDMGDTYLSVYGAAQDEAGNIYYIGVWTLLPAQEEVEINITEEVDVALYNLNLEVMGNMALVTAGGEAGVSFWLSNLTTLENHYGAYLADSFSNIYYGNDQLQAYGDGQYAPTGFTVAFITKPDAEGNAVKYNFTLLAGDDTATAIDNINATVAPVKVVENGQLIIINNGVQYNAQGAVVK